MSKKYHIEEMAIFKFIADEFNNNSSNGKVKFSIGYYFMDEEGQMGGFSRRFIQENGRFDVKKTLDNDTYELNDTSFVPMSIPMLNANYLAHDVIKEVTYEPTIEFLVYVENIATFHAIELVLKELRARFIQYQTTLDVSYINIDDTSGDKIQETLKVIAMSGEINYGNIVRIANKAYLSISMPLTLEVTNHGEYANQERIYLSVPSIENGAYQEVQPLAWNWGTGVDTYAAQTLNDKTNSIARSQYSRHIPKVTAFSYGMALQIDFRFPILRKIYKDSRQPTQETVRELWLVKSEVSVFNYETKQWEVDDDLSLVQQCILDKKALIDEVSKGEKIIFGLSFVPAWLYSGV